MVATDMRALHLDTLLADGGFGTCEDEPGVAVSQWSQNSPRPTSPENQWIQS